VGAAAVRPPLVGG